MAESSSRVIVLAGPNGAGKTTASRTLLADTLKVLTFVNADVIAQGLAGFNPDSAASEASRIMLERLHTLADQGADFAFETTLAARSYASWLRSLREKGYHVHLMYFWPASADLAVARVAQRVRMGGHGVPEATIRQRYQRSLQNFLELYRPVVRTWECDDNSQGETPLLIAFGDQGGTGMVLNGALWSRIRSRSDEGQSPARGNHLPA